MGSMKYMGNIQPHFIFLFQKCDLGVAFVVNLFDVLYSVGYILKSQIICDVCMRVTVISKYKFQF